MIRAKIIVSKLHPMTTTMTVISCTHFARANYINDNAAGTDNGTRNQGAGAKKSLREDVYYEYLTELSDRFTCERLHHLP